MARQQKKTTSRKVQRGHVKFTRFLRKHDACVKGFRYVRRGGYNIQTFWARCSRPGWMVWLLLKTANAWPRTSDYVVANGRTVYWYESGFDLETANHIREQYSCPVI